MKATELIDYLAKLIEDDRDVAKMEVLVLDRSSIATVDNVRTENGDRYLVFLTGPSHEGY